MSRVQLDECLIETCVKPPLALDLCASHYRKYTLYGDPEKVVPLGRKVPPGEQNPNWRGGKTKHELYEVYIEMIARCERPAHVRYKDYGGRGLSVHPEWRKDFWAFVRDVGKRPEGKTPGGKAYWQLDRIDNDRGYEPGNVRWATPSEQCRNRRESAYSGVLRGSQQSRSKLTEDDVTRIVEVLETYQGNGIQRRLAEEYGVSNSLINDIWSGRIWAWHTGRGKDADNGTGH